jgi:Domain of unknown function (DUF4328)
MSTVRSDESVAICTKCDNEQAATGLAVRCVQCGEPLPQREAEARSPHAREFGSNGAALGSDRLFSRLTTALQWIFGAWAVFAVVGIAFRAIERSLLSRASANRFSVSRAEALASDHRIDTFAYVAIAALVVTGVVFIVWFHRAYRKTRELGGDMRYSDGWAIGAWFIPIGWLWIPKKLANDIWWGTERPEYRTWRERPALLTSWWLAWVFAGVGARFFGNADDIDEGLRVNLMALVDLALIFLAAVFALFVVRQIGQRLAARSTAVATLLAAESSPSTTTATPRSNAAPHDALASGRPQPWRLIGATVAVVAIAVGTVTAVSGSSSSSETHTRAKPVDTAPAVSAGPAPPNFDRHESVGDAFAISVPNSWMTVDLTAPDVDQTLEQLKRTNPEITDYLDQQKQSGVDLSFVALDPAGQVLPAQLSVMRLPTDGQSLDEGARQAQEVVSTSSDLVGTVDRKRVELPAGATQVLSFKIRNSTPAGEATLVRTMYVLGSGDSFYTVAFGINNEQAPMTAPTFEAIMRSLELTG